MDKNFGFITIFKDLKDNQFRLRILSNRGALVLPLEVDEKAEFSYGFLLPEHIATYIKDFLSAELAFYKEEKNKNSDMKESNEDYCKIDMATNNI